MSDESIAAQIERLVAEEHDLRRAEQADSQDEEALQTDRDRLRSVEVELDSGDSISFEFPASAHGETITLTHDAPQSIGWSDSLPWSCQVQLGVVT